MMIKATSQTSSETTTTRTYEYRISKEQSRTLGRDAFWGKNELLADRIKQLLGYEENGRDFPSNTLDIPQAVIAVLKMNAAEVIGFIKNPVHAIMLADQDAQNGNDIELLSGDETSMKLFFNNITGRNFSGKEYTDYLEFVKYQLGRLELEPTRVYLTIREANEYGK